MLAEYALALRNGELTPNALYKRAMQTLSKRPHASVLLHGDTGIGKSTVLAEAAMRAIEHDRWVAWTRVGNAVLAEKTERHEWIHAPFAVLDQLYDIQWATSREKNIVRTMLIERHESGRVTWASFTESGYRLVGKCDELFDIRRRFELIGGKYG
jgi:hypothetical protein